jgi:hypothetical protein
VAAKIIYRELFRSKSDEQLFDKEVRMLRSLHHPHVIQYVPRHATPHQPITLHTWTTGGLTTGSCRCTIRFLGVCQFKEKRQRCIVTELMEKGCVAPRPCFLCCNRPSR